ncbi:efflux transporter, RND family, MFP subunit [Desulfitobacterium hafniense DCB-2]|uniref:Efflux transporter, RND family, MFP subunit n=1 Tax=Desulfitobacterium hafniense (strain DSM 10664 / DCB-2) TaxID=272564 RepID=B8FP75_DESHD|nr:efflux RND transporter periplasmic adaptor subunit [Desulfitobacterium hafniense]ACL19600.1 efflux transporter, RND family, MFP subunit [Desulfitobacterium hafniense DCB-2]
MQPDASIANNVHGRGSFLRRHRKKLIVVFILLVGVLIASQVLSRQAGLIPVSAAEVVQDDFEQNVFASGKLEVKDLAEFKADTKTTVQEIPVKAGDKVSKGQIILVMDTSSLSVEASQKDLECKELRVKIINSESNIRLFQQAYDTAQKDYNNTKVLMESGAASLKELEQAGQKVTEAQENLVVEQEANLPLLKAQLKQAEVLYQKAQEKLQKATIHSPYDGTVLNLAVKAGQEVENGTLLAQIGNPAQLLIETGINEVDAALLKVGDQVEITNSALLKEPLLGSIETIAPTAEVVATSQGEQTQVKIRISVPATEGESPLKPGFNVNLKVILQQKEQALLVPLEAVIEGEGQKLVYVVGQDGIVSEKEVQTGLSNELFMEIVAGLQVGEKVILNPDGQIKDGVQVIVNAQSN